MKRLLYTLFIFSFSLLCTPSVFGQKCSDYDCVIRKVKNALSEKNYRLGFEQLESAEGYTNKNVAEVAKLRKDIFNAVEKEKQRAETATNQAKIEAENAKREQLKADIATKRAEKNARASENIAAYTRIQNKDSVLARRMIHYTHKRHPENTYTNDIYDKTFKSQYPTYLSMVIGDTFAFDLNMSFAFSPDGKKVVTGGGMINTGDGMIKIWDVETGRLEKYFVGHEGVVNDIVFSPDGKKIITISEDHLMKLWNIENGINEYTIGEFFQVGSMACFSPDNKKIVAVNSLDNAAKIWDIKSGKLEKILYIQDSLALSELVFSPDGKKLIIGVFQYTTKESFLVLWDIENELSEKKIPCSFPSIGTAFSPDGKKIMYKESDSIRILDIPNWKLEKTFKVDGEYILFNNWEKMVILNEKGYIELFDNKTAMSEKILVYFAPYHSRINKQNFLDGFGLLKQFITISPNFVRMMLRREDGILEIWVLSDLKSSDFDNKVYAYSLYEMQLKGLQIEPEDKPQYLQDSTLFVHNYLNESINSDILREEWKNSEAYKNHLKVQNEIKIGADSVFNLTQEKKKAKLALIEKQKQLELEQKVKEEQKVKIKQEDIVKTLEDCIYKEGVLPKKMMQAQLSMCQILIDTLIKRSGHYGFSLTNAYSYQARCALFLGKIKLAKNAARKAIDARYFGHALLLQGKYDKALRVYAHILNRGEDRKVIKEILLTDLKEFEASGITHKDMAKAKAELEKDNFRGITYMDFSW